MGEWTPGQLEGPGMPVARTFIGPAVPGDETEGAVAPTGEGEGEGDDGKTYCVCNGVSYGEMIACDDASCDTEWVSPHSCILLLYSVSSNSFTSCVLASKSLRKESGTAKYVGASVVAAEMVVAARKRPVVGAPMLGIPRHDARSFGK